MPPSAKTRSACAKLNSLFSNAVVLWLAGGWAFVASAAAPSILSTASLDGRQVGVCFDQSLGAMSANTPTNYQLDGGAVVTAAALQSDGRSVKLAVGGLGGSQFVLTMNGVQNLAGETASLSVTGSVLGLELADIGSPAAPGVPFNCLASGADLRAGGANIYGVADSFSFLQQARDGDFDVRMQLARLDTVGAPGSHYTRAGLMVRESLAAPSRNLFAGTYSRNAALDHWIATARLATGASTDFIPGSSFVARDASFSFPNAWFRLRRNGNTFLCYYATNGDNWVPLGNPFVPNPPYPQRVYLGLAASSIDNNPTQTTFAQFRSLDGFDRRDTNAPTLLGAGTVNPTRLLVEFSEPVDANSATNASNYQLDGGSLVFAGVANGPRAVLLTTSPLPLGGRSTLTVNGVRDRANPPNPIAADSQVSFTVTGPGELASLDLGGATPVGSTMPVPTGATVTGGGRDIGGLDDEFQFSSQLRAGDFDVKVRVAEFNASSPWAKAGLMARENLAGNSPHASMLMSPGLGGVFFASRPTVGDLATQTGSFPANDSSTWLRLRREGTRFTGFAGLDGQHWTTLGVATLPVGEVIYLGFGVSSRDTNQTATVQFLDFSDATNAAGTTRPLPFEPLSASSRRGGIVISEIMYHPAARADGSDLEFVELYNSQVFFEDLSGYRLSGDIDFTFPAGTILPSGGFLVIAKDPAGLRAVSGVTHVLGPFTNSLPNASGTVRLRSRAGAVLLEVNYGSRGRWPRAPDGAGHSLVLSRPSFGEGDVQAWSASDTRGGSPGRAESRGLEPARAVVINEFLANTDPPELDFIELRNAGVEPVDLSGCYLSDDPGTNKFRISSPTVLPAGGLIAFDQTTLGFSLRASGETIYLVNSNRTRVLDAVGFEGQAVGIASGRVPVPGDAIEFLPLQAKTPGAPNVAAIEPDLVINEIMYHPISQDSDDEYVELFNRGTATVDVGGWRFIDGIQFTFPANTLVSPGGFLVVARNATNLLGKYPGLSTANTVGDFGGTLANGGERIALARPEGTGTNAFFVVVEDLTYGTGGRWGQWADGGGSSLELIDPRSNNRLAANWADSDESAKSSWTTIEHTGVLDNGGGIADSLQIQTLGAGECLVDNVEVRGTNTANLIANSTFESGVSGWVFQGNHDTSGLEPTEGFDSSRSLRVRALGRGDPSANRIRVPLTSTVSAGSTATLRAQVRWLRGDPELLLRFHGNYLEAAGRMNLPRNLGTPGAPNSRAVANAGPAISDVNHHPVLPAANEPVVVTARVHDPDGLNAVQVVYRRDPEAALNHVTMRDDGAGGDAVAGDGVLSAIVPGQAAGVLVAFHIAALDNAPAPVQAQSRFPNDAPVRECLVRFGETQAPGGLATYRLWMTQATFNRWSTRYLLHNTDLDVTFVHGQTRAIYNVGARWKGSSWSVYDTPTGALCGYRLTFPKDDRFLGITDMTLDWPRADDTGQAQQMAFWVAQQLDAPSNHRRFVHLWVNGAQRGTIYEDAQQPNGDMLAEFFPGADDGDLYKMEAWVEFAADVGREDGFWEHVFLRNWTTTGGAKKVARYRWSFLKRAIEGSAHDFTNIFRLVDTVNIVDPALYTAQVEALVDVDEWMRVFAMEHICGNWDSYSYRNGHNMYCYLPPGGRWNMLAFDIDFAFGVGSTEATSSIFEAQDPAIVRMFNHPPFRRAYLRAMQEAVDGPLSATQSDGILNAKFEGLTANGVAVGPPTGLKSYRNARRASIQSQIASAITNFGVNGPNAFATNRNWIALTGTAPLAVQSIAINGVAFPITWTSPTAWRLLVPLAPGTNGFEIAGYDRWGRRVANATQTWSVHYTGSQPAPADHIVINEIMYNPLVPEASFVELWNTSTNSTFDLSGWRLNGLNFTFPPGTLLTNRQFAILAKNRAAFAAAYGASIPVLGEFDGQLDDGGETLSLISPGAGPGQDVVVDQVKYDDDLPWPAGADGLGAALQLLDATQDNSRVANWSDGSGWRFASVTGAASSSRLSLLLDSTGGDVFLDDIMLVPGTTPGAGLNHVVNGDFESALGLPWVIGPLATNSHLVTDVARSGGGSLHLVFRPGSVLTTSFYQNLLPVVTNDVYTLSFWYLPGGAGSNVTLRISSAFQAIRSMNRTTPGTANNVGASLPPFPLVWLNEAQPGNRTLTDRAGEPEPWIELFHSGSTTISLAGLFLSDRLSQLDLWPFPDDAVLNPGEYKIVFADGEPGESTQTEWHTNFRLPGGGGAVVLSRRVDGTPQIVDYLSSANLPGDRSFGSFPDGQLFDRQEFVLTTPGAPNSAARAPIVVFINEWMADNGSLLADPADDDFEDWFELHNPGDRAVDLAGYYLSDNLANKFQFTIPWGYTIPARGYLVVWADNEPGQNATNRSDLHVSFQLAKAGEAIGLFAPDGTAIDTVTFGAQTNNISQGRCPGGAAGRVFQSRATPGGANICAASESPNLTGVTYGAGGVLSFTFGSRIGETYRIEYKNDLNASTWTRLGEVRVGTGSDITILDNLDAQPQRFYRVVVEP